ncbi:MAG TPA: hypothetical protein DCS93_08205 [Microscillaceae bacterium]|nr:hypothetical protein [Microscillaceae bacterium]
MKRFTILLMSLGSIMLISAQFLLAQTKSTLIDQYLSKANKEGFAGVVLVAQRGKVIFNKGYGMANREKGIAYDQNSVFDIGSITKQFTGAAIVKLEMEGKLKTSDLMSKYLPNVPATMQKITLHHLLTHSAGLPSGIGPDEELLGAEAYLKRLYAKPLKKSFGSFVYSNVGYSLLAMVVEKASGMSYEKYLQQKLFKPAGMTQTGYVLPRWKDKRIVMGYQGQNLWGATHQKSQYHKGVTYHLKGNGGIMSTILDMHKWYKAIKNNTVLSKAATKKYIGKQILEREGRPFHYGYGWSIEQKEGREITWHNGGNGYFSNYMGFYPNKDLMIFVGCNTGKDADPYAHTIDEIMHGGFKALDASLTNTYAGTYQLPNGQKFKVRLNANNQLVVPINRSDLYLTFSGTGKEDNKIAKDYNHKVQEMANALAKQDYAAYGKIESQYISSMNAAEIERQIKSLFDNVTKVIGKPQAFKILGSVSRRGGKYYLTASQITFAKSGKQTKMYFFHYWTGNRLVDLSRSTEGEMMKRFNHQDGKKFFARSNQLTIELVTQDGVPALKVGNRLVLKRVANLK